MYIDDLIRKLEQEKQKYGNIEVRLHAPNGRGGAQAIEDIATFSDVWTRSVWLSSEPAE